MSNKSTYRLILIMLFSLSLFIHSNAQERTMFYMYQVQQKNQINPAINNECNFHIGLPVVSSVQASISSSSIVFMDFFTRGTGAYADSLMFDMDNIYNKLDRSNLFMSSFSTNLLQLGFHSGSYFVNFSIIDRIESRLGFNKDMFGFLLKGNGAFLGQTMEIGSPDIDFSYFREYGLALSTKATEEITVGGRFKLFSGILNLSSEHTKIDLYTDPDNYNLQVNSDLVYNFSLPFQTHYNLEGGIDSLQFQGDQIMNWLTKGGNLGFGLDLGLSYASDRFEINASVLDIGVLNWKKNVFNFKLKGETNYQGIEIGFEENDIESEESYLDQISDSLSGIFDYSFTEYAYVSSLAPKLFLGAKYSFSDHANLGILTRTCIYKNRLYPSLTVSGNFNFWDILSTSISWSGMNGSFLNLGLGIGLRLGPVQLYMINDNVLGLIYPHKTNSLNFRAGLNLVFGCN